VGIGADEEGERKDEECAIHRDRCGTSTSGTQPAHSPSALATRTHPHAAS
jgi:hypothetical protein